MKRIKLSELDQLTHTPGPWKTGEYGTSEPEGVWIFTGNPRNTDWSWVAVAKGATKEVTEANARLIAAAPDMLDALKAIAKINLSKSKSDLEFAGNTLEGMQAVAEAAIAKAELR